MVILLSFPKLTVSKDADWLMMIIDKDDRDDEDEYHGKEDHDITGILTRLKRVFTWIS